MTEDQLLHRFREVANTALPLPGHGASASRHHALLELGRENLSLARLAEAHFDAVAIFAEAGRTAETGATYGVWASEKAGLPVTATQRDGALLLNGTKMFCSGAGIVDRALVTVQAPEPILVDLDLRGQGEALAFDDSGWKPSAFALTQTATVTFRDSRAAQESVLGDSGWYLRRPGFWHGALGPASCWAGGALGIVEYARSQSRSDPHTLAHRAAMEAAAWSMRAALQVAGDEIDAAPADASAAHARALAVRHVIEQSCTEILQRFGRAFGPHPLAFVEDIATRCQELTLYLRQCHAERDLAALGELLVKRGSL